MTVLADFSFTIDNLLGSVHVGAVGAQITTALASNIRLVKFDASSGVGQIVYNDRPPLPEMFSDPSPYQSYINSWITALAAASPALTLAQAIAVKSALLDAVWVAKIAAPVSVSTSLGTFSFDAGTGPTGALNFASWLPVIGAINTSLNAVNSAVATEFSNLVSEINTTLASLCTGIAGDFQFVVDQVNSRASISAGYPSGLSVTLSDVGYRGPSPLATISASVQILPVGATSYPAFTVADLFAVMSAAASQRATKSTTRAAKQAVLGALTTIPSVVSYDVTAGW